ncbi:transcription factor subunit Med10 of mediator complex-domain-containing protein [Epithele typhae]|uniref:transcription factor subunit Med10 of mediator complex-domain-containing protein n=1 Tax=Epithele typhae TaxID=378194 RepID=UPI0020074824|nr:transcription factor subunit Med10 of mediator complex-domain-containing protein [Epithele typhae]KAH9921570.1 transcription factor subunit Med10 of mediator complex-domain-containing protein [Epithele typhae]
MARNMSTPTPGPPPLSQAPDSPRESESPPPQGVQGDLEVELLGLATSLYNLGTTVVNDLTKEKDKPGGVAGKPVGQRVNDVIRHLATLEGMSEHMQTMVPMDVLVEIDNSRNPMTLTKERLERAATENQFMNGKIHAIESYKKALDEALVQNFPELSEYLTVETGDSGVKFEEGTAGANRGMMDGVV